MSTRCKHKAYRFISSAGVKYTVQGGNCLAVSCGDFDIVVGLDRAFHGNGDFPPWRRPTREAFGFTIPNMGVPPDLEDFEDLLDYLIEEAPGKRVFVGCIGGHGRTGLVLAALYARCTGNTDAIAHVRANYCKHVVETAEQVAFLRKHYGCDDAVPSYSLRHPKQETLGLLGAKRPAAHGGRGAVVDLMSRRLQKAAAPRLALPSALVDTDTGYHDEFEAREIVGEYDFDDGPVDVPEVLE